uniref:RING-type E3 ubiquitin transferase n=1 Tax=Kalanchoe fedtschenkoi TaxID=63787 RepID=A0A7N0UJ03_KALFE
MARFLSGLNSSADDLPSDIHAGTDFVAVIAAFLCALICVLGVFAMARCAWLRRTTTTTHSKKGADKKLIQTLPKFTFTSSAAAREAGFATEECAICLAEFAEGNEIRVLPDCGHGFHAECVDKWLAARSSCPSCRQCLAPVRCQKCGHTPAGRKAVEEGTFLP